jgi:hypothetical protein
MALAGQAMHGRGTDAAHGLLSSGLTGFPQEAPGFYDPNSAD